MHQKRSWLMVNMLSEPSPMGLGQVISILHQPSIVRHPIETNRTNSGYSSFTQIARCCCLDVKLCHPKKTPAFPNQSVVSIPVTRSGWTLLNQVRHLLSSLIDSLYTTSPLLMIYPSCWFTLWLSLTICEVISNYYLSDYHSVLVNWVISRRTHESRAIKSHKIP